MPGKNADAPGQRLFQRFQPILSMAGNHQYAITDVAVDIHLLVDERHAFVVQQVYLVEHDNRLNLQGFAGHQVTVDNIERQLRQNGGDNDNLVDVGGYGFHAVVEIRTR